MVTTSLSITIINHHYNEMYGVMNGVMMVNDGQYMVNIWVL